MKYLAYVLTLALLLSAFLLCFASCDKGGDAGESSTAGETTGSDVTTGETTESETTGEEEVTTEDATGETTGETTGDVETVVEPMDFDSMDLTPYVTLGAYKNIPVTLKESAYYSSLCEVLFDSGKYFDKITAGEDKVAEGDYINVNYKGILSGVAFEGGTAENQDIVASEGSGYIEGFASGFLGAKVGASGSFLVTFPENYGEQTLAGKEVTFEFTVNCIYRFHTLTDAIADELSDGAYPTAEAYEGYLRNLLIQPELWNAVIKNAKVIAYPEQQVQYYYLQNRNYYETYGKYYGMEYEEFLTYLGITDADLMEAAKAYVLEDLVYYAIKKTENIVMPEDYYNAKVGHYIERYKDVYGYTDAQIEAAMDDIRANMTYDYAQEVILSFADVTWEK